jgi:hypothetical protein
LCPKIALPKFWLANFLVELFLAHKLVNIGYKNKLDLVMEHWQAKKIGNYLNKDQSFSHDQKIGMIFLGSNPNTPIVRPAHC